MNSPTVSVPCATCGRAAGALRKGLCRACYLRAWRGAELPLAACCALCPERRRMVLRWTRLGAGGPRVVTCQNCGFLADKLRPRALSLDELKARMSRDRRLQRERRQNYVMKADGERRDKLRRTKRRIPV